VAGHATRGKVGDRAFQSNLGASAAEQDSSARIDLAAPCDGMPWPLLEFRISQRKALAVDLRSAGNFDSGHVPKALSFPLEAFGAELDSPIWQSFRDKVNVHHFVVLYGDAQPTDSMRRFRRRLLDELGYSMVMFANDGFAGWERRHADRKARVAEAESKARSRMAAAAAAPSSPTKPSPTVPAVKFAAASALPNVLWIDARSVAAYGAGHIPGAISIPGSSEPAVFERLRAEHPADRPIVVYCGGAGCSTSRRVAERLVRDFGFTQVHHMPGGYAEWQQTQAAKAASQEDPS
jgi:rhodanese-related sulfurtransferase